MNHYQNSECKKREWLHDYQIIKEWPKGIEERCTRCKDRKFFPKATPNHIYLSFHIRQALQPRDPRFSREYPDFKTQE